MKTSHRPPFRKLVPHYRQINGVNGLDIELHSAIAIQAMLYSHDERFCENLITEDDNDSFVRGYN